MKNKRDRALPVFRPKKIDGLISL